MDKKEEKKFAISNNFNLFEFGRNEIGTPKVDEVWGRDPWIKFGINNDYPQELVRLFQNADGLHAALVRRKTDMIAGMGFIDNPAMAEFIKNSYSKEDLEEIAYKIAFDIVLFGGYYLNVIWSLDRKRIAKIYHVPFEKVRVAKPESEEDCDIEGYYISRDWYKPKKEENKPYYIAAFTPDNEEIKAIHPSQLLFTKVYTPGMDYYCLPSYAPITNYLKLSYEVSTFHLKSCQNSYLPGMIVSIPHVPNPVERERMSAEIKARSGTDQAGQTVVVYGESPDKMPTFTVINPIATDAKFKDLAVQLNENIYIGHNANNVIAGVAVSGKLANTSEVKEQFAMFQKTVITPLQNNIERTLNYLASINGIQGELKFAEYTAVIDDTINNPAVSSGGDSGAVETPVDVEAAAKAALKGSVGGVQGILAIQAGVVAGTTTYDSALAILDLIYGISEVDARKILGQPKTQPAAIAAPIK